MDECDEMKGWCFGHYPKLPGVTKTGASATERRGGAEASYNARAVWKNPPSVRNVTRGSEMKFLKSLCCRVTAVLLSACSHNIHSAEMATFLNAHFLSVMPDSGKVRFVSDGTLGVGALGQSWRSEFLLGEGERFMARPHRHGNAIYEVRQINEESIVIRYKTDFDSRSFGKDFISSDTGEVAIPYKTFAIHKPHHR
ncbi:hypothetical protein [Methylomagnum sp.]